MPAASITGMISRATNGNETKIVASTIPGTANTILMSCSDSHGPSTPCRPNSRTNTIPAITGETANGRSISVVSSCLPRKSNFAIAQPAHTPNSRLAGTAMAAAISVSFSAAIASGSRIAAK